MKTTSNQLMAMLVLGLLAAATKAQNCPLPPDPANQAWIDTIKTSRCTVVNGDLHLGRDCKAYDACFGVPATLTGAVNLGAVETITGRLTCLANSRITTVTANKLTNVGAFEIAATYLSGTATYNTLLTGFSFPALVKVSGEVYIVRNAALTSMGLGALQTVGGDLDIQNNNELTSMGLGALQTVGGDIRIRYNYDLTSDGLGALQTVGGYLDIGNNEDLTFMGLGALQTVGGYLKIWNNDALTSMGLGALQTVGGYLKIVDNDALTSNGLGALQTVGGDLDIRYNYVLPSVGLGALQTVGGALDIYNNLLLGSVDFGGLLQLGSVDTISANKKPLTFKVNGCFDSSVLARAGVVLYVEGFSCSPTSRSPTAVTVSAAPSPVMPIVLRLGVLAQLVWL